MKQLARKLMIVIALVLSISGTVYADLALEPEPSEIVDKAINMLPLIGIVSLFLIGAIVIIIFIRRNIKKR